MNTQHLPTFAEGTRPALARLRNSSGWSLRNLAACSRFHVSIIHHPIICDSHLLRDLNQQIYGGLEWS